MQWDHEATTQTGFSLLEVLITLVVLGAGLISLVKFQGTVLQDNDLAKARSVAAQLAEQKLEDLRGFTTLAAPIPPDPLTFAFTAIGKDTGGRLTADGALVLPSGTVSTTELANSNVTYTRTWKVADFCFPIARNSPGVPNSPAQLASGGGCRRPIPDFKNVTVIVAWTDQDDKPRHVSLATSIAAVDPAYSGRVTQINGQRPALGNELYEP